MSFLTLNEKRVLPEAGKQRAVGYAPLKEEPPSPATEVEQSSVLRKYRPDQPRAPRGQSDGGQWVDEGGGSGSGGGSSDSRSLSDANSDDADFWKPGAQVAQNDDDPPKIPKIPPKSGRERNRVIKEVAKWAGRYGGPIGKIVEGVVWAYEIEPYVSAYLDEPQTLEELQKRVSTPAKGYDIHHIVEQTPAEKEGFGRDIIDGPDNLVRIPTLKHLGDQQLVRNEAGGIRWTFSSRVFARQGLG